MVGFLPRHAFGARRYRRNPAFDVQGLTMAFYILVITVQFVGIAASPGFDHAGDYQSMDLLSFEQCVAEGEKRQAAIIAEGGRATFECAPTSRTRV